MSKENVAKEYFEKYIKDFEKRIGKNLTTEFNEHLKVLLNQVEKQQKEIEEKSTIIMAGAKKVKQLEKEIEREKQYTDFYKDLCNKQQKEIEELKEMKPLQDLIDTNIIIADYSHNYISKDKIRELIKKYRILNNGQIEGLYNKEILALQELLEEN